DATRDAGVESGGVVVIFACVACKGIDAKADKAKNITVYGTSDYIYWNDAGQTATHPIHYEKSQQKEMAALPYQEPSTLPLRPWGQTESDASLASPSGIAAPQPGPGTTLAAAEKQLNPAGSASVGPRP